MNDHFKLSGVKFYRFEDDSEVPKIIRLYSIEEEKKEYKVIDCSTKEKKTISFEELESKWIKLNPDGVIVFALCTAIDNQNEEVPDIMVNLHRIDKEHNGVIEKIPYCTCRQAVIDIFALIQQSRYIAGMCISKDTCPPELDYKSCLKYNKMARNEIIAVYLDDHMSDILELFNNEPYNRRLELIKSRDKMGIQGYQSELSEFLKTNYFMYDFHAAFNVHELKYETLDFEDDNTNRLLTNYIISTTQDVPTRLYPIPYTKYIDLNDIKRKYILVCPFSFDHPDGNITLVAYDISQTISYKDLINKGRKPTDAKKEIMQKLGWM